MSDDQNYLCWSCGVEDDEGGCCPSCNAPHMEYIGSEDIDGDND
jgi:hypothetical protein